MSKKYKILMISVALASLASVRCTKEKQETLLVKARAVENLTRVCDVGMPPQPPVAMYDQYEACFGEYECGPELKVAIATWIYALSVWTREAVECIDQAMSIDLNK